MSNVTARVGDREYRHPLEGGEFRIFPAGWVGQVDAETAAAMFDAEAAEDLTPRTPDAPVELGGNKYGGLSGGPSAPLV